MSKVIEATSTITTKGQTTVPKAVRQMLGIGYGGKLVYRIEDGCVTLNNLKSGSLGRAQPARSARPGIVPCSVPKKRFGAI